MTAASHPAPRAKRRIGIPSEGHSLPRQHPHQLHAPAPHRRLDRPHLALPISIAIEGVERDGVLANQLGHQHVVPCRQRPPEPPDDRWLTLLGLAPLFPTFDGHGHPVFFELAEQQAMASAQVRGKEEGPETRRGDDGVPSAAHRRAPPDPSHRQRVPGPAPPPRSAISGRPIPLPCRPGAAPFNKINQMNLTPPTKKYDSSHSMEEVWSLAKQTLTRTAQTTMNKKMRKYYKVDIPREENQDK
jgi:hypothetical protein